MEASTRRPSAWEILPGRRWARLRCTFCPQYANSGALAVSGLLLMGLGGLLAIWRKGT